jgi:hypothetical protein
MYLGMMIWDIKYLKERLEKQVKKLSYCSMMKRKEAFT